MTYTMEIEGMHCGSCSKMIKMEMEDRGFTSIQIDMLGKTARFESSEAPDSAQQAVKIMEQELGKYRFINLKTAGV